MLKPPSPRSVLLHYQPVCTSWCGRQSHRRFSDTSAPYDPFLIRPTFVHPVENNILCKWVTRVLCGVSRHSLSNPCLPFLPSFLLLATDLRPPFCPSSIRSANVSSVTPKLLSPLILPTKRAPNNDKLVRLQNFLRPQWRFRCVGRYANGKREWAPYACEKGSERRTHWMRSLVTEEWTIAESSGPWDPSLWYFSL